ncbi:helix-turn-helix domain-containing protein [Actinacidiphila sp. bgisy145]|uniref:helix-turn-helix domain-containing protein n=1 Tax=Actinacidiphila sp. bgisy145 TaxID=3413792 RepID=UPI003EB96594
MENDDDSTIGDGNGNGNARGKNVRAVDRFSARALYANRLAYERERSGMSLVQLGEKCRYEQSYLHRLETGGRLGTVQAARALDAVYGTGDLLERLWWLAKRETKDRLVLGLAPFEANAAGIQEYANSTVPDLLQTRAYAHEQLHLAQLSDEQAEEQVTARLDRHARLTGPEPVHYRALIDEAVLRRKARDPKTWTAQLEHLIEAAQWPGVALHVLPYGTGPHHLRSALELVYLRNGATVAYTQGSWSGHLTDDPEEVEPLRIAFDSLRDTALPPAASLTFLRALLDEHTQHGTPEEGAAS